MKPDADINKIYNELLRRIQHIGIALQGQKREVIRISDRYDVNRTDTPSVGEAEDAFLNWNCAIFTAFRGSQTLSPEENFKNNL